MHSCFPRLKVDIVHKCFKFGYGDMQLDWDCGEYTQITQSVIENPEFQTIVNECRSRGELLWAGGQACIRVVCICVQGRHRSVAVSSTLRAVYLKVGFNSLGPFHFSKRDWSGMCHTCKHSKSNDHKEELFTSLAHQY